MKIKNQMKAWTLTLSAVTALLLGFSLPAAAEDTAEAPAKMADAPAKMAESPADESAADDSATADAESDQSEAAAQDQQDEGSK